jgi:hypothetical protein
LEQFDTAARHAEIVGKIFSSCATERRKPNTQEKSVKKLSLLALEKCSSRAGHISPYLMFDQLYEKGIATMLRTHPPDILHTLHHGTEEYNLGCFCTAMYKSNSRH